MLEEIKEDVSVLNTVVFGHEGQGGLVREVQVVKTQLHEVEKKVNTISGKYLALITLLGILGQFLAKLLIH